MSRYDGLIIPRSYSEYINKTDAATLQQALQLPGVLSGAVAAGDNKPVKSSAVYGALADLFKTPTSLAFGSMIGSIRFIELNEINEDSVCETIVSSEIYNSINYIGIKSSGGIEMIIGSEYIANVGYKVGVQVKLTGTDIQANPSIKVRKCIGNWNNWVALV